MTDLFGGGENPVGSSEEVRKTSGKSFRTSFGPKGKVRKFGAELSRSRDRVKFGAPTSELLPSGPKDADQKFGNLLQERSRLQNEIEQFEAELAVATAVEEPYLKAQQKVKRELYGAWMERRNGGPVTTADILDWHDLYLAARCEWWPYGKVSQHLGRVLEQTRRELKIVNAEIGV